MLSKTVLESYLEEITKGKKTLTSYNVAFSLLGGFIACAALISILLLAVGLFDKGFFDNVSMDTLGTILKQNQQVLMFGYAGGGGLLLSVLTFQLHLFLLRSKMKKYIKDHHDIIVHKHKSIFKDHSSESIEAFANERDKQNLLETLNTQTANMSFVVNNYENLNDEYEEVSDVEESGGYDVNLVDEDTPSTDFNDDDAEILHPDQEVEKL